MSDLFSAFVGEGNITGKKGDLGKFPRKKLMTSLLTKKLTVFVRRRVLVYKMF